MSRAGPPAPENIRAAAFENKLSPRETQVIGLLAQGATWKAAAAVLEISVHTVEHHVLRIRAKLHVQNTAEAVFVLLRETVLRETLRGISGSTQPARAMGVSRHD